MSWPAERRAAVRQVLFSAVLACCAADAAAGWACEERQTPVDQTAVAFDTALNLAKTLDASGQKVAIIARRGQQLDKYGLSFSHAGFAMKTADGWTVVHALNICGSATEKLFTQGLADFYADDLVSKEIAVAIPEAWLQDRLAQVLASKDEVFRMYQATYSAVAYPFSTKYQNSNGWLLETYARAASDVVLPSRDEAQAWLKVAGYKPSVIDVGPLSRLGGRMFKANVFFDDHPPDLRWSGKITVNTGDAVLRFVAKHAMAQPGCGHGAFPEAVCLVAP
jgi:hypothetical protein